MNFAFDIFFRFSIEQKKTHTVRESTGVQALHFFAIFFLQKEF